MKKWTVMMIPHGKGATRNLSLSSFHIWVTVASFCVLAFASTFTFQLYRTSLARVDVLERQTFQLRTATRGEVSRPVEGISPEELAAIEPDGLTPFQALELLYKLSEKSREVLRPENHASS